MVLVLVIGLAGDIALRTEHDRKDAGDEDGEGKDARAAKDMARRGHAGKPTRSLVRRGGSGSAAIAPRGHQDAQVRAVDDVVRIQVAATGRSIARP